MVTGVVSDSRQIRFVSICASPNAARALGHRLVVGYEMDAASDAFAAERLQTSSICRITRDLAVVKISAITLDRRPAG